MYKQNNSKGELKKVLALDTSCLLASYFTCNRAFPHSGTAYFTDDGWSTFFFFKVTIPAYFLPRTTRGVELALGVGDCVRAGVCAVDMEDIDSQDCVGSSSLVKT